METKVRPNGSYPDSTAHEGSNKPALAGLCCGRLKVGCAKDTNWLLLDPNELQRFAHQTGGIIKRRRKKVLMNALEPAMELIRNSHNYFATNRHS